MQLKIYAVKLIAFEQLHVGYLELNLQDGPFETESYEERDAKYILICQKINLHPARYNRLHYFLFHFLARNTS
jgi:hypothetical protein